MLNPTHQKLLMLQKQTSWLLSSNHRNNPFSWSRSSVCAIMMMLSFATFAQPTLSSGQPPQMQQTPDNWVLVQDTTQNEVYTYVNRQSVTPNPDNANWRNFEFVAQAVPGAKPASIPENGSIALDATLDCSQGLARINQVRIHTQLYGQGDLAGTMAGSRSFQPQNNETTAHQIIDIVCK